MRPRAGQPEPPGSLPPLRRSRRHYSDRMSSVRLCELVLVKIMLTLPLVLPRPPPAGLVRPLPAPLPRPSPPPRRPRSRRRSCAPIGRQVSDLIADATKLLSLRYSLLGRFYDLLPSGEHVWSLNPDSGLDDVLDKFTPAKRVKVRLVHRTTF